MRDYQNRKIILPGGKSKILDGPKGDMVILDLEGGNYLAVRPSGTEPKVKIYMFTFDPPENCADLDAVKAGQARRLAAMETDMKAYAG
jgi:phosphoglucomutase/phosphomannomutase